MSALLALALGALWGRSFSACDTLERRWNSGWRETASAPGLPAIAADHTRFGSFYVYSEKGNLILGRVDAESLSAPPADALAPPGTHWAFGRGGPFVSADLLKSLQFNRPDWTSVMTVAGQRTQASWQRGFNTVHVLPYPLLIAPFALLAILPLPAWLRRRRKARTPIPAMPLPA